MQGKEGNENKLLPKDCKMWMKDHLIRMKMMIKNQVQEVEGKHSAIWCLRTKFGNGLANQENVSYWKKKPCRTWNQPFIHYDSE